MMTSSGGPTSSAAFNAVSCAHSLVAKPKPSSVSARNVRVA